jgi:AraC family transcriptional regulator
MTGAETCTRVTFGVTRREVRAGDFLLTESEYAPGLRTQAHAHSLTSLVFGLSGGLEQVVLPRNVVHSDQVGAMGCSCLFVSIGPARLETIQRYTPVLETVRFATGDRIGSIAKAIYHESRTDDSVWGLAVEGLVYGLLASLSREPAPRSERNAPWLSRLHDRLAAEFTRPRTLADLAREAGVHPTYLVRAFAREYGISISRFIRTRRIEWAMDQLRQSNDTIREVAQAAGFFDQSHFTRCFKRMVGSTPARFRQNHG